MSHQQSEGQPARRVTWIIGQVAAVLGGISAYFGVRGFTEGAADVATANAVAILELERWLGIDVEHQLQAPVVASETLVTLANWVYIWGHWPVIAVTMIWLVWRHGDVFLRLRDAMFTSAALGMTVFVTFPVAPPRLLDNGMVDTITEHSVSYRVLQPPAFVDQYAAMPSLHAGWDLLVGISIATAASSALLRAIGCLLPMLMTASVVVTANHYILDVVVGILVVLCGNYVALRLERRRRSRSRPTTEGAVTSPEDADATLTTRARA